MRLRPAAERFRLGPLTSVWVGLKLFFGTLVHIIREHPVIPVIWSETKVLRLGATFSSATSCTAREAVRKRCRWDGETGETPQDVEKS